MASRTIKGELHESYGVTISKSTITLDKNAFLFFGGKFDLGAIVPAEGEVADPISLAPLYGIYEDVLSKPSIKGNTYNINGEIFGFMGAVSTFGDSTKINVGKTADLSAGLGIGVVGLSSGDISDLSALSGLTIGTIFAGGDKSKITIAKGADIGGLFGVTVTGSGSSVTNSGEIRTGVLGMMAGSLDLTALVGGVAKVAATPKTSLVNNGEIQSLVGIAGLSSEDQLLHNGAKGEIKAGLIGMMAGNLTVSEEPVALGVTEMVNDGHIMAAIGLFGLSTGGVGGGMELVNSKSGDILAGVIGMGVFSVLPQTKTTLTNAGTIEVTVSLTLPEELQSLLPISSAAVLGLAGKETFNNTGTIIGDVYLGAGNDVVNSRSGVIRGDIILDAGHDVVNSRGGIIKGDVLLGNDNDVFNSVGGTIKGRVLLGDGNDTMNYASGTVSGKILGGLGDDTIIVTKASQVLTERIGEGTDTVRSSVSYTLNANVENLVLTGKNDTHATGNALANVLTGNSGDNVLKGGDGADIFVFSTGGGKDRIADFDAGELDVIDVSGWKAATNLDALSTHATDTSAGLQIKFGSDVLIITGMHKADLDDHFFTFAI